MKVLVAGTFESDSLKAHAVNTIKMAQGFARCGAEVTLLCRAPESGPLSFDAIAARFGIPETLRLVQLPFGIGEHATFAVRAIPAIARFRPDFVYARSYLLPWLTSALGIRTAAESHAHPDNRTKPFLRLVKAARHRRFVAWVTISNVLSEHYLSLGVPESKLLVLPDSVDLELFLRPEVLPESPYKGARARIVYAGHLYDYKGIPTILDAARRLPEADFHFLGGLPGDLARQKDKVREMGLKNVIFHGYVNHACLPEYLWHADVLLLPPSGHHPSARWTSPVKLGEYLASGTPVIATGIPALKDWLTDNEVLFVKPDDADEMADAISKLLSQKDFAKRLADEGLKKAISFSYTQRARNILAYAGLVSPSELDTHD